jgi:hypothetical protein
MGTEHDIEYDPGREPGIDEIVGRYSNFINDRPALLSLLYDVNMLPSQTVTRQGAMRLATMCEMWKKGEAREPAGPAKPALTVDGLAQEIRRIDGNNSLGAGALAEALMPFLEKTVSP